MNKQAASVNMPALIFALLIVAAAAVAPFVHTGFEHGWVLGLMTACAVASGISLAKQFRGR